MAKKQKHTFKRSIDEHAEYYLKKSMVEKLSDTLMLSNLCLQLQRSANNSKTKFSGK
jgi:hypothetical protein